MRDGHPVRAQDGTLRDLDETTEIEEAEDVESGEYLTPAGMQKEAIEDEN